MNTNTNMIGSIGRRDRNLYNLDEYESLHASYCDQSSICYLFDGDVRKYRLHLMSIELKYY